MLTKLTAANGWLAIFLLNSVHQCLSLSPGLLPCPVINWRSDVSAAVSLPLGYSFDSGGDNSRCRDWHHCGGGRFLTLGHSGWWLKGFVLLNNSIVGPVYLTHQQVWWCEWTATGYLTTWHVHPSMIASSVKFQLGSVSVISCASPEAVLWEYVTLVNNNTASIDGTGSQNCEALLNRRVQGWQALFTLATNSVKRREHSYTSSLGLSLGYCHRH